MHRAIDYTSSIVLFSGGMDSTVSLYYRLNRAVREGGRVHALTLSYGQRHTREVASARMIMQRLATDDRYAPVLGHHVVHRVHLPAVDGALLGGDPVTKYADVREAEHKGFKDNSFIPYRNLLFLTYAAIFAHKFGAGYISTGLRGGFPDCTESWERDMAMMLHVTVPDYRVRIDTPTHRSRADTIKLAEQLPGCMDALAYSLTCFEGSMPPCGHCLPCLKRAEGFASVAMDDPLITTLYGVSHIPDDPV